MNLTTIVAISDNKRMVWETHLLLESFKRQEFKYPIHILIFKLKNEVWSGEFDYLQKLYPNVKFFIYEDDGSVAPLLHHYSTIHRLYSLQKHFEANRYLEEEAILYLDSDIIITKPLDLDKYLKDDICYGANVNGYNSYSYFIGKEKNVESKKLEKYHREKPLEKMWGQLGIDIELLKKFDTKCGGVHYLLKNIKADFFYQIFLECVPLIKRLRAYNQVYMKGKTPQEKDNNGWQAWCADIFLTLWFMWKDGKETEIAPELDFTWATDPIERLETLPIYHNANIVSDNYLFEGEGKSFYKSRFNNQSPFDHEHQQYIENILQDKVTQKYANWYYTNFIKEVKDLYFSS